MKKIIRNTMKWSLTRILGLFLFSLGLLVMASFYIFEPLNLSDENAYILKIIENSYYLIHLPFIAGFLFGQIGFSSLILVIFLLIWGSRIFLTFKLNRKILRIIALFFSIIIFSGISYNNVLLKSFADYNLLGKIIYLNFLFDFYIYFNIFVIHLTEVIFIILLIPFVFFSMGIKNNILIVISKYFYWIVVRLFKLLFKLPLVLFKTINVEKKLEIKRHEPILNPINEEKQKVRVEPSLIKKTKKIYVDPKQSSLDFNNTNHVYELPGVTLLKSSTKKTGQTYESDKVLQQKAKQLESVLSEFGIQGSIRDVRPGPIVTMYELVPSAGTKASRIINLADDIARSMSALSARISSQPGRNIIGIELPNLKRAPVMLGELLNGQKFIEYTKGLPLALGRDIAGSVFIADLEKMPHLLIAGTTGSGKSVGINSMVMSLLYKFKPSECRFIMIDPKMLELSVYEDIPHLLWPVVTDPYKAITALKWAVKEMENRYRLMNHAGVKNVFSYNDKIKNLSEKGKKMYREITTGIDPDTRLPIVEKQEIPNETFPYIIIVIDEMADLMMAAGKDVEHAIQRLAQMARAAGIHLIMATQRPSVDVITGTIKANFPSRISYHVASKIDSRTILNEMGAEQLLGSGDMLFMENGGKITRLHGGIVSENEISDVVNFIKNQSRPDYLVDITKEVNLKNNNVGFDGEESMVDELYEKAVQLIVQEQKASTSFIQRHLKIGYNRAASIIEQMEKDGLVSESNHVGKREVLKKNV